MFIDVALGVVLGFAVLAATFYWAARPVLKYSAGGSSLAGEYDYGAGFGNDYHGCSGDGGGHGCSH